MKRTHRENRPENDDEWLVSHELGTYQPLVDQYDAQGKRIGGEWEPVDADTIAIYNPDVASVWLTS